MASTEPKQTRSVETRRRLLDAAVDELVTVGYARLTTPNVARRAGVSRGAQQHHFADKAGLVGEAVQHLIALHTGELRAAADRVGGHGPRRVEAVLDVMFTALAGPLFKAVLDLSLAAQGDEELAAVIGPLEREVARRLRKDVGELFGPDIVALEDFDQRFRHVVATIRGLALLRLLGHSKASVDRQWRYSRQQLVAFLTAS